MIDPLFLKLKNLSVLNIFKMGLFFLTASANNSHAETFDKWLLKPFGHQILHEVDPKFGGLSGISVSPSGEEFVVISDKANYFTGKIVRNKESKLVSINVLNRGKLLSSTGTELSGQNIDSESIIKAPSNGYYISFESNNRVMFHNKLSASGIFLPKHPDFKRFKYNEGIEALALNHSGRLYAIPESPPRGDQSHPIYKLRGDKWIVIGHINIDEEFKVTDAEFIDDQNLILLERKFTFLNGFVIRIRRIFFENDEIKSIQVLLESEPWEFYNLEGLSQWKDEDGNTYLTLISDNQFSPLLKTEIREFLVVK